MKRKIQLCLIFLNVNSSTIYNLNWRLTSLWEHVDNAEMCDSSLYNAEAIWLQNCDSILFSENPLRRCEKNTFANTDNIQPIEIKYKFLFVQEETARFFTLRILRKNASKKWKCYRKYFKFHKYLLLNQTAPFMDGQQNVCAAE